MIRRFEGEEGKRLLVDAIRRQRIVQGDETLAVQLSGETELREVLPDEELIVENESDNDFFFILSGRVSVVVKGRQVALRGAGEHVGEMSLIDPGERRAASVRAIEETVVAAISEPSFSAIANSHPRLWRLIAVEVSSRLRQRNGLVQPVNQRPVLFVGSSTESLCVARAVQESLEHDPVTVTLWTDDIFGPSQFPVEALEEAFDQADFGVLVVAPDDEVISRKEKSDAPRDNVVFELGMSMGALGRFRSFVLKPRGVDLKIPTDLLGIGDLEYENTGDGTSDLSSAVGPACNKLRRTIESMGCR